MLVHTIGEVGLPAGTHAAHAACNRAHAGRAGSPPTHAYSAPRAVLAVHQRAELSCMAPRGGASRVSRPTTVWQDILSVVGPIILDSARRHNVTDTAMMHAIYGTNP